MFVPLQCARSFPTLPESKYPFIVACAYSYNSLLCSRCHYATDSVVASSSRCSRPERQSCAVWVWCYFFLYFSTNYRVIGHGLSSIYTRRRVFDTIFESQCYFTDTALVFISYYTLYPLLWRYRCRGGIGIPISTLSACRRVTARWTRQIARFHVHATRYA
jgi:hypothetical protein